MTSEQQRIAIAEACGWTPYVYDGPAPTIPCWTKKGQKAQAYCGLPDYLNDLDAMHEAELTLPTVFEKASYHEHLDAVTDRNRNPIWFATAPQRAEAFLRAVGKWKD